MFPKNKNYFFFWCFLFLLFPSCASEKDNNSQPKAYQIVYNVLVEEENDNYEIFSMDMDGKHQKNISNWKGVDWVYHTWKDKIYFLSDRDTSTRNLFLYEMDVKGDHVRKITDFKLRDSWFGSRNNGEEFIVTPHPSTDSTSFFIIDKKGKIKHKIAPPFPFFSDPNFSPNGEKIVFRGGSKKNKREDGYSEELYIMESNGENLQQLTHYPTADTTAEWYAYKAGPPIWNQKENFISYQSKQAGKYSLYAVTPDGKKQWKLTKNSEEEGWHAWSADGKWLAIELFDSTQTQFHIGLMNWETKALKILTDTSFTYQQAPAFVELLE